jgi:hypothetical protein
VVRRPAKVDELESHRGAETIPGDDLVSLEIVPQFRRFGLPFWTRMFKLSLTVKAVSKIIRRKLSGKTS